MKSIFCKVSSIIFLLFSSPVFANTALVMHSNYQDAHTNVKAQLEATQAKYNISFVLPCAFIAVSHLKSAVGDVK